MTGPEVTVKQQELIRSLFLSGHGLDFVCERGAIGVVTWTRATALEVVRRSGWELDGSGRVPRHQRPLPPPKPRRGPPTQLGRRSLPGPLEAVARWAEGDADGPAPAPAAPVKANAEVVRRPAPAPAAAAPAARPAPASELASAVERFLAECTVDAPDDQFITGSALRSAYEAWRGAAAAPEATTRRFGVILSAKYRRKQAKSTDGSRPVCYAGLAWKPTAPPAEKTPTKEKETAPETAISGHGNAGPDAQPQVSPSPLDPQVEDTGKGGELGASDAPAEPPAAGAAAVVELPAGTPLPTARGSVRAYEHRSERPAADEQSNADGPAGVPGGADVGPAGAISDRAGPPAGAVDVLALGLAHPDRAVRAKARRVVQAVDDLIAALARRGRR